MSHLTRRTLLLRSALGAAALPLLASRASAAGHNVAISGFAFAPNDLTIAAGDTVTFTNSDSAPHTVTADNGSFDTGRLNTGQAASLSFAAAGTYGYHCNFHPNMTGTITVT